MSAEDREVGTEYPGTVESGVAEVTGTGEAIQMNDDGAEPVMVMKKGRAGPLVSELAVPGDLDDPPMAILEVGP